MKVLKNLFGNNTKINANNIAVKKADNSADTLDNCVIVDSGSNSNGSWIKWADGTMICYLNRGYSANGDFVADGSIFLKDFDGWTFPKPFIITPFVQVTNRSANAITPGTFYATKPKSTTGETVKVSYIAVGKWK